ncbi:GAF and ANTAR domain-containing protein [Kribbella monticola]|uniref:GAF and ANTAR domain-containing protein n=1 Tax=Kribbella monticola TaxID=2185285 RepID=UPI000DD2C551|nr:GAF and ANTAR domain-containing protein [Kribbella monticola]
MELPEFADLMTTVAESLRQSDDLDGTLALITASVVETIAGVTHASISVTSKNGTIQTLAPTDEVAHLADQTQYELHEGPCVEAALNAELVQVDELGSDSRWPQYGPRAAELGLRSQLSFQFRAEPNVRGALNLYADEPAAFGPEDRYIGAMFANCVAVLLGWNRQGVSLSRALESRGQIGTAVGILMERYRLDQHRAFAFLVRSSQTENVKLREVAAAIVTQTAAKAA